MKVITFAIQKGGTGKTSTAVSVAVELAEKGHSVIFIDADPQAGLVLKKYLMNLQMF